MERGYQKDKSCVYCGSREHRTNDCTKVLTLADRREHLKSNKLCFNCTGKKHNVVSCRSRGCLKCGEKHHTSIRGTIHSTIPEVNGRLSKEKGFNTTVSTGATLHAMVKGDVKGQEIRIMIDTGASSSYVCSSLITKLNLTPAYKENRCTEQMFGTITKVVEIYQIKIESTVTNGFSLNIRCINGERDVLTYLPNPQFQKLKRKYKRLERMRFCDEDNSEDQLPIHIMLGAADYQRIRSAEPPVLGENPDTDPGAEYTMFGWILYGKSISTEEDIDRGFQQNLDKRTLKSFAHWAYLD